MIELCFILFGVILCLCISESVNAAAPAARCGFSGTAINPDSTLAAGAHVTLSLFKNDVFQKSFESNADSNGAFYVPLDPKIGDEIVSAKGGYRWGAVIQSDKGAMAERVYDIYLWQEIVVPPLTVKKSVGIIAGHVFDSAGKPVNGALITTNQDAKTVTDKNGCFRLEGLHSDWVELKVKSNDGEEAHQDFHDGKPDVKIVLTSKRPT